MAFGKKVYTMHAEYRISILNHCLQIQISIMVVDKNAHTTPIEYTSLRAIVGWNVFSEFHVMNCFHNLWLPTYYALPFPLDVQTLSCNIDIWISSNSRS